MGKRFPVLILALALLTALLSGCSEPSLPSIDLDASSLTCTVESIGEQNLKVVVTVGDSHYDGPYQNANGEDIPGETILVAYTTANGTITEGCTISFNYHYTADVSRYNGYSLITVEELKVK